MLKNYKKNAVHLRLHLVENPRASYCNNEEGNMRNWSATSGRVLSRTPNKQLLQQLNVEMDLYKIEGRGLHCASSIAHIYFFVYFISLVRSIAVAGLHSSPDIEIVSLSKLSGSRKRRALPKSMKCKEACPCRLITKSFYGKIILKIIREWFRKLNLDYRILFRDHWLLAGDGFDLFPSHWPHYDEDNIQPEIASSAVAPEAQQNIS